MQVNPIDRPEQSVRSSGPTPAFRAPQNAQDHAVFRGAAALNRALHEHPDTRTEEVARARDLAASVQYPPAELIRRISRLLANNWSDSGE